MRWDMFAWAAFVVGLVTLQGAQAAPAADTVKLVIDYGDGAQLHFSGLAWRDGITAFDVLALAQKHPHGVKFRHRGTGAHAKVEQIDNLTNEGDGKNWIYSVNGKQGEVSSGIHTLKRGDTVLWKFQIYE
jgi:phosphotransferase system HPr-like phosphotransfer protein